MHQALRLAEHACDTENEVPVGAVFARAVD